MRNLRLFIFLCLCPTVAVHGWARGCRPDVVRQDRITKQRVEVWTQVLSSTSFLGSLWGTSETTVIATVGRYGSLNAVNVEIHKREGSFQNALVESAYRGAAGKSIFLGFKDAPPVELVITNVGNDARVSQGVFAAKAVTTVVLSAALSNDALARLRESFTTRYVDAVRIMLSGDVRIELPIDEDTGEELLGKFASTRAVWCSPHSPKARARGTQRRRPRRSDGMCGEETIATSQSSVRMDPSRSRSRACICREPIRSREMSSR
jgi:hypothetical protein